MTKKKTEPTATPSPPAEPSAVVDVLTEYATDRPALFRLLRAFMEDARERMVSGEHLDIPASDEDAAESYTASWATGFGAIAIAEGMTDVDQGCGLSLAQLHSYAAQLAWLTRVSLGRRVARRERVRSTVEGHEHEPWARLLLGVAGGHCMPDEWAADMALRAMIGDLESARDGVCEGIWMYLKDAHHWSNDWPEPEAVADEVVRMCRRADA